MRIAQRDLAEETGTSTMTVCRALKAIGRSGERITEIDALSILVMSDLQNTCAMAPHIAAEVVSLFASEIRYLEKDPAHRCWIVFAQTEQASFQMAALNESHLAALLDDLPMGLTLALHRSVERARQRLDSLKTRKANAA